MRFHIICIALPVRALPAAQSRRQLTLTCTFPTQAPDFMALSFLLLLYPSCRSMADCLYKHGDGEMYIEYPFRCIEQRVCTVLSRVALPTSKRKEEIRENQMVQPRTDKKSCNPSSVSLSPVCLRRLCCVRGDFYFVSKWRLFSMKRLGDWATK
jgi:hypothetical protein